MATLDETFFVTRAQQLFPAFFAAIVNGLAATRAQAAVMANLASLQDTWHARAFIDQATDIWLDLHARGAGKQRGEAETDAALRNRIRQLPNIITPNAVLAAAQAVQPGGVKLEILEQPNLSFVADKDPAATQPGQWTGGSPPASTYGAFLGIPDQSATGEQFATWVLARAARAGIVVHVGPTWAVNGSPSSSDLSQYQNLFAAVLSARAAGIPALMWIDPYYR